LFDRLIEFDGAVLPQADVAVRIDESRHDPAAVEHGLGIAHRLRAQRAAVRVLFARGLIDDPPLDGRLVGEPAAANVEGH
jgi:hypothetical protein